MEPRLWIISRKHPPAIGGMEELSYHVARELASHRPITLVTWHRSQRLLPVFLAWAGLRLAAGLVRGRVSAVLLGDPVLSLLAVPARLFGRPVAVTVHGLDVVWPNPVYQSYLRRFFFGRMSAYICISTHVRDLLEAAAGQRLDGIAVVPGGAVEPPRVEPAPIEGEPVLLLVARLVRRKGALWFVRAVLPGLVAAYPRIRLVLAGDGPELAEIRRTVAETRLTPHVDVRGVVSETDKWALYLRCTALVIPNLVVPGDVEGFGLTALEAGACGKCVFAADIEGLRDAVSQGVNGWRLPAGDAPAWIAALTSALGNPERLEALGARARDHVRRHHSWYRIGEHYAAVIDALAPHH